jgi:cobyric acid synthase
VGSLLIAGTTSDAGKTTVVTGLCRWLARRGVRVAPYKAQNMSNNSMVCGDGAEIGRAQWIQAVAAGAEPEAAMNPVLLKPGSDRRSHVVLMGEPWGELTARGFLTERAELAKAAFAAYDDLASRYDVVISEGAGSPTEINLRQSDYVNMGLAQHTKAPVVVVGDIDRVRDQQVPGRCESAAAGDRHAGVGDRAADVRRTSVASRSLARLGGRARRTGSAALAGLVGTDDRRRAVPPDQQLHRPRRARDRTDDQRLLHREPG